MVNTVPLILQIVFQTKLAEDKSKWFDLTPINGNSWNSVKMLP